MRNTNTNLIACFFIVAIIAGRPDASLTMARQRNTAPALANKDSIQPYHKNPRYRQYKSKPVLLAKEAILPYENRQEIVRVIYDNDGTVESGYPDVYVYALASAGLIQLEGIITTCSYKEWGRTPPCAPLPEASHVRERQELIDKARRSGLRNLPNCSAGPSVSLELRRPPSGRIEDTTPIDTPGSRLIVNEARKSTPQKPLVILMGGQATAVADAYLLDNSIAAKMILVWLGFNKVGSGRMDSRDYNSLVDPWATYIATQKLRVVVFPYSNDGNMFNDGWPEIPRSRFSELPDTELRRTLEETIWPDRGVDPDSSPWIALTQPDYVLQTKRFSFDRWEARSQGWRKGAKVRLQTPTYKEDSSGEVLAAWQLSERSGTLEWWTRLKDPRTWGKSQGQVPYTGTPRSLPGKIEAEHFDHGGTDRSYLDTTNNFVKDKFLRAYTTANCIRIWEHVDLIFSDSGSGKYKVGKTEAGEWIEYTVDVATAETYTFEARVASKGLGGSFHVDFNGMNKTGTLTVPDTGDWESWQTVKKTGISLSEGRQVMRLVLDTNGASGCVGHFDCFIVTESKKEGQLRRTTKEDN